MFRRLNPIDRAAACSEALAVAADDEAGVLGAELVRAVGEAIGPAAPVPGPHPGGTLVRRLGALVGLLAPRPGGYPPALVESLVRVWARLGSPARDPAIRLLRGCPDTMRTAAIARALEGAEPLAVRSAAGVAGELGETALADSVARLLVHADTGVADAAERALASLATAVAAGLSRGVRADRVGEAAVDRAVTSAVRTFPVHRRRSVLELAARLLDPARLWRARAGVPSLLTDWFGERDHESHMALRGLVRRSDQAWMRGRAWEWLGGAGESVAAAALERVTRAVSADDHGAVLMRTHLLANPTRRRRLGLASGPRARGGTRLLPGRTEIPDLHPVARRGIPWLAAAVLPASGDRLAVLEPLLTDPDAPTRYGVARVLAPGAAIDLCFDADERVAWLAAARGSAAGLGASVEAADGAAPPWRLLSRSPHRRVRALAEEELAGGDPWDPHAASSRLAARRRRAANPAAFADELRARVREGAPEERVRSMLLARHLRVAREIETEVIATLRASPGDDDRAAATAAALLGELDSPESLSAIAEALRGSDDRVRANAVEALSRRARRSPGFNAGAADGATYSVLVELKDDPSHRVRANSLRAMLAPGAFAAAYESAAAAGAAAMLRDERPLHRVAAIWLSERVLTAAGPGAPRPGAGRWNEVAAIVADVARSDPIVEVRTRAGRAASRLLAATRVAWRERAPAIVSREGV